MKNLITVGVLALVVYGWNFWGTSIYMLDEVKNAWSAYEMQNSGNLFVPVFNGEFHDKPGLPYFFMQLSYFLFGVNAFSARLFSVLFGVATVLVVYLFAKKNANTDVAILSNLALITSLQLGFQFKMSVPDPYLIFFLTCAFSSYYNAYTKRDQSIYLFYLFAGLGFVTKGPIAIALPALVVALFLVLVKDLKFSTILWTLNWKGILIFLAVGTPWYIANGFSTDWEWTKYFFITHNVDRYLNTFEGHGGFPLDTFALFFAALLPFSVFFPQAFKLVWNERSSNPLLLFCTAVCIAFCGFFLFSRTVLPGYISPALPFGAIILANYLQHLIDGDHNIRMTRLSFLILLIITTLMVAGGYIAIKQEETLIHLVMPGFLTLVILPVGVLVALFFLKRNVTNSLIALAAAFFLFQSVLFSVLMPAADRTNPVVLSKKLIQNNPKPFAYYKRMNPAFVFQHHQNIQKLNSPDDVKSFAEQHGEVLIISTIQDWQPDSIAGFSIVFQAKDLYESPQTVILSNLQAQ